MEKEIEGIEEIFNQHVAEVDYNKRVYVGSELEPVLNQQIAISIDEAKQKLLALIESEKKKERERIINEFLNSEIFRVSIWK